MAFVSTGPSSFGAKLSSSPMVAGGETVPGFERESVSRPSIWADPNLVRQPTVKSAMSATLRGRDCGPDIVGDCPNMHSVFLCTYVQPAGMWNRTSLSSM